MQRPKKIPHNAPSIGTEEASAIEAVLASGWVAEGAEVATFERSLCTYAGFAHDSGVAVSSGTAALFLALYALDVHGREVIVPTYVCSAVLNAVYMAGATPVLADINEDDLNISPRSVSALIGKKTGAIIVTHTFGMPADVAALKSFGVPVIEDCAQALGSRVAQEHVGHQGAMVVFSFYASKMITTGYGGMLVSQDRELIARARDYRAFDGRDSYKPRFNFQLSDINAAIGTVQLQKLPHFLERRRIIFERYRTALSSDTVLWPEGAEDRAPNFYRILLRTPKAARIREALNAGGIASIVPIERFELLHRYLRGDPALFPIAEKVVDETLSLPAYPALSEEELDNLCVSLGEVVSSV